MKTFYLTLILSFFFKFSFSQPMHTKSIKVKNAYFMNKSLCFEINDGGKNYFLNEKNTKKNCPKAYYSRILISVNEYCNFIFKKDTMTVKILFDKYSPLTFEIKRLFFKKGTFIFDLKKYFEKAKINTYPIHILDFPNDYLQYIKEENE